VATLRQTRCAQKEVSLIPDELKSMLSCQQTYLNPVSPRRSINANMYLGGFELASPWPHCDRCAVKVADHTEYNYRTGSPSLAGCSL